MEVKEAIEFIENGIDLSTRELEKEYLKKMDGVISLLQQGEIDREELKKVWQMWEEFKLTRGDYTTYIYNVWRSISALMDETKQKYFPKEEVIK